MSLYALAASPLFSVPAVDLARCGAYADRRNRWLFDVLRGLDHTPELRAALSAEGAQAIGRLVKELERYLTLGAELGTGELLYQFLTDSGWLGRMSRASTAREEAEVQNVARFFRRIQDATRVLPRDHVREFVSHLDALIQAGEDPAVAEADVDVPAVRVLTVHKAKGLEFPVVFVVGLVQGRFPWRSRGEVLELPDALLRDRPSSADFRLQEERRLFYVAMTRAKDALHLTSARDYGGRSTRKVSQFVLEALDLPRDAVSPTKTTALEELRGFASPVELEGQGEPPLDPDAVLELSHRQVDDYRTCPLKYRYVHVLRVPIRRHHTVVYGETLHRVVEHYLRRRAAGLYTPLDALLETYEREWRNEGFLTWAHEAARRDAGREAIRRFWHEEEASGTRPTFVEREFGVSLGGAEGPNRVRGRWDRVDETEAGPVIIDYKSSDVREPERATERAADSLQLQIYGLVWREMFGRLPARVELRFLESGVVGEHEPTEADAAAALEAVQRRGGGDPRAEFHRDAILPSLPVLRLQPDLSVHGESRRLSSTSARPGGAWWLPRGPEGFGNQLASGAERCRRRGRSSRSFSRCSGVRIRATSWSVRARASRTWPASSRTSAALAVKVASSVSVRAISRSARRAWRRARVVSRIDCQ